MVVTEKPVFLDAPEVAAILRVSKMTVYRLIHRGELTAHRIGRQFRIDDESVNNYLGLTVISPERESTDEQ